ncbi:MAG: biotin--[acetyl-CoA-carboxylase] ligase [bacterium]|jgi:BirA family biotin operon repressor/biotin-[acetyl-CoA-carboxylase] ligase
MSAGPAVIHLEEVGSTNTYLKEHPELLLRHGQVVRTERQTQGRGRMGRTYISLHGKNLTFSVVLHVEAPPFQAPSWSLWVGVAIARVVERHCSAEVRLKWPNDILLNRRKVCGILIEAVPGVRPSGTVLIAGIGLNCQGRVSEFPVELQDKVTTLQEHASREILKEDLFQEILSELNRISSDLSTQGKAFLEEEWLRRSGMLGRDIHFEQGGQVSSGRVLGLTEEGFLRILNAQGAEQIHASGDVWE